MKLPWTKRETRTGSGGGSYTDAVVQIILSAAGGETLAAPGATAALEMVAGVISRAFASAELEGPPAVLRALPPSMRSLIGRNLVRTGETILRIDVRGGRIHLEPAGTSTITGGPAPESWLYELTSHGPSETRTVRRPAASVVHIMYGQDVARPWRGVGPMQSATLASRLSAALSGALADEAGGPRGRVLPVPQIVQDPDDDVDPIGLLKSDLSKLNGGLAVVESMADSFGAGAVGRATRDWEQKRLGADPPDSLIKLQEVATREVLAAFGIAASLFSAGDGTASREAWRQAIHGVVIPLARIVEQEIREKLDAPAFAMKFDRIAASDISGRARAFQSLVGSGMDLKEAASLTGLMAMEE